MKSILVPYRGDPGAQVALATACRVARRFDSYVEGLFVRQPPPIIAAEGITLPGDYLAQFAEEGRHLAERSAVQFRDEMQKQGFPLRQEGPAPPGPGAGWRDVEGLERQVVGEMGRVFDLIAVGCTQRPPSPDHNATCEAALFESGRPVLVAAPVAPDRIGENVVIAWNCSTETARTVALAMPFLHGAREILVLTVTGGTVPGPPGEEVVVQLARHGIRASALTVDPGNRPNGQAILDECARVGADLLVKGAYTQSRLRQMIFGGATRHILSHAELPVLLAH